MRNPVYLAAALALCFAAPAARAAGAEKSRPVNYAREVQPILAKHCLQCHGPNKAESGLKLNQRDSALGELDSGNRAITPGKPQDSELLKRVASTDESQRMPPEGKPLNAAQIDTLRRWIAEGAEWRQHWAYEPVQRPKLPQVKQRDWARSPIDAFVLEQLESSGISTPPPADKVALLRRATYDLTGLPPTWEEVQAFAAEKAPNAFEKVVDRLLDSPCYGEHWARHWLDVVRFAETNSFERDNPKPHAWRFRDYVIRSLNEDKPYDQFIREQVAGDELPEPTSETIVATGFYRLGLFDDEPADRALARYDELDDIITTVSQGFLALTVNCARCHDHKIDPIPQRDYYKLLSFFNNIRQNATDGPNIEAPIFVDGGAKQRFEQQSAELQRQQQEIRDELKRIEGEFAAQYVKLSSGEPGDARQPDLEDLEFRFYRDTWDKLPDFNAIKAETVGRVPSQLFDIGLATRETAFGFVFDGHLNVPRGGEYTFYLDSDDGSRLRIDGKVVLEYDGIHGLGEERRATVNLDGGRRQIALEYFQRSHGKGLKVEWSSRDFARRPLSRSAEQGQKKLDLPALLKEHGKQVLGNDRFKHYKARQRALDELQNKRLGDYALCVTELGGRAPDAFLLFRGNPAEPRDKVSPGFPEILDPKPAVIAPTEPTSRTSHRRLALADWLASKDNKLTARVMVNRVWQHHFGRGIVRSPNNFGGLGTPPTHPALLDWLASDFMDDGWRLKRLHKRIMLSSTYQMSSRPSEAALDVDPGNNLFSRFEMHRLGAEEVRDAILAVSGRLNQEMFGPSIYPEISAEVMAGQSQPGKGWGKSSAKEQARRSVYIHVKRSLVHPLLSAFDFPDTDFSCEARFSTTQPAQALSMINGKFLNDEAAAFATRLEKEAGDDPAARIRRAHELTLCRPPTAEEVERSMKLLATLQSKHGQDRAAAWKLFCLAMLNRNEFLYLD